MRIERVLAPNPGPYTGPGTNTWLLDGGDGVAVIDPGPLDHSHEAAVVRAVGERSVAAVVVTHTHEDHAPLANPLARNWGVAALGPGPGPGFVPDEVLADGAAVPVGDELLEVVATPGHSDDHLCFLVDRVLFTGDHIMGGSSVMVEDMSSYLRSLERVRRLGPEALYPGHGEVMEDPSDVIDWYVAHRLERERQVRSAVNGGATSVAEVVAVVYADVDRVLHPLATRSVVAHLHKLAADGDVKFDGDAVASAGQA